MQLTVQTREKKEPMGDLFGIFFEDINYAADGGLYGELVQNRAFEYSSIDNRIFGHYMRGKSWKMVEKWIG